MNEDLFEFRPFYYNICENIDVKQKGFNIELTGNSKVQQVIMKQSLLIKQLKQSRVKYLQMIQSKSKQIKGMEQLIKKYETKDTNNHGGNTGQGQMSNGIRGNNTHISHDQVEKKLPFDDKSYDERNVDLKQELKRLGEKYKRAKNRLRQFDNRFNDIKYVEIVEENTIFNEVCCQTDQSIQQIQQSDQSRQGVSVNNDRDLLLKIKQLESQLQTKSNKIRVLSQTNENLVKKQNEQENRDKEYKKMIDGLYEQIKKYQSLSNNSPQKQKQLEDIKNEMLSNKDKQINELKQEIQNLSESKMKDLSQSRRSILISKQIEDESKQKDKTIGELKDSLVRKDQQNVKKIEQYETQMEKMKQNHDYAVKHYVQTINRLEAKVSGQQIEYVREQMKVAIEQKDKLIDGLQKQLQKLKSGSAQQFSKQLQVEEIKRLNRQCETKENKINQQQNKINKLQLRIQQLHQLKQQTISPIKLMQKQTSTHDKHKIIPNFKQQIQQKSKIQSQVQKLRKINNKLTNHLEKVEYVEQSMVLSQVECQTDPLPIEEPTKTILMTKNQSNKNTMQDSSVENSRIQQLESKLCENEKIISNLRKENEVLARDNDLISENVVKLSQIMSIKSELEARVQEYEKSLKLLKQQNTKLVEYKNKQDQQLATNFGKIEQLSFETQKIRETLSEKQKQYNILKQQSQTSIHQMGITIGQKQTIIQNLKKQIQAKTENVDKLQAQIAKLKEQIEKIKDSQQTQSKQLKAQIDKNKNVASDTSDKDQLINNLQTSLSKLEAQMSKIVTQLKMQIENSEKRQSSIRKDHENEITKIKREFTEILQKKEEQIKQADLQKQQMNSQLKRLAQDLNKAEHTLLNQFKNNQQTQNTHNKPTVTDLQNQIKQILKHEQYQQKSLNSSKLQNKEDQIMTDQEQDKDKLIKKLEEKVKKLKKKEASLKQINNKLTNDLEIVEFQQETFLMCEVQCQTDLQSSQTNKKLIEQQKLVSQLHIELNEKIKTIEQCKAKIKVLQKQIQQKPNVKHPNYVANGRKLNFNQGQIVTYSTNKTQHNQKQQESPLKSQLVNNTEKVSSPEQILYVFKVPTTEPQTDSAIINKVIKKNLLKCQQGSNTNILQIQDLNNIEIIFVEKPLIRDELVDYDLIQPALILKQKSQKNSPQKGE